MATHRGIEATCQAVVELLRDDYAPDDFMQELEFRVLSVGSFHHGLTAGVSLFLYRVLVNGADRTPPGRRSDEGGRLRHQLPLDLHFMLTAWAKDPSLQHSIAGWMMRTLEDHTVLPAALLNRRTDGVFRPDETVELGVAELATEDLLHLWELLGAETYQLSVPYLARNVRLESHRSLVTGSLIQDRITHHAAAGAR